MKIIYLEDGFHIFTPEYKENHKEIIFGLDEKNQPVQNFTFTDYFTYSSDDFNSITKSSETVNLQNGYLLYSFLYEKSYAHYLTQTIPKLYDYLNKYRHCNLLIPKSRYNILCRDILQHLNINNVVILQDKIIYNIKNFILSKKYNAPPSGFTHDHVFIYNEIRKSLNITPNITQNRNIYLKRDGVQSKEYGNDETGINRHIINEDELITKLQNKNFEIITLGTKSIMEKKQLLENANIIITSLGANCMNLIFTNAPKHLIYLSNKEMFGEHYFWKLSEILNNTTFNCGIMRYDGIQIDPLNPWNKNFYVDVPNLLNYIEKYL